MSDHYLIVDDARREYVDCDKFLLDPDAWDHLDDFRAFHLAANNGFEPPPEKSDRYSLCEADARRLFDWMRDCTKKLRIVSLDSNDFRPIEVSYKRISLYPECQILTHKVPARPPEYGRTEPCPIHGIVLACPCKAPT